MDNCSRLVAGSRPTAVNPGKAAGTWPRKACQIAGCAGAGKARHAPAVIKPR